MTWLYQPGAKIVIAMLVLWTLVWKGVALWKAGRAGDKWWFVLLLVINTAGILELIYIFAISRRRVPHN